MNISILSSFKVIRKTFLGVDIGTSSLKIVELSSWGERTTLKNYGELQASLLYDKPFRSFEKNALLLSSRDISRAIRAILEEAKILTKSAVFSIPDFSSFFTNFDLPPMSKEELPNAIQFEARKQIPVPISEVTFDWQLAGGKFDPKKTSRILLVAVPNDVISQYQEMARLARLNLSALEVEVFGFMRAALRGNTSLSIILVDIGAQTTALAVVRNGILGRSQSIDVGGNNLTQQMSKSLTIEYKAAEEEKHRTGIVASSESKRILAPFLDMIIEEIRRISLGGKDASEIQKIVIGGGSARLPGLKEYFQKHIGKKVEIIDPFKDIFYPPILEKTLQKVGPSYAVAIGAALRGLE
ncbi:type IV pilus assembly protein PilM [Patescibacteria group bacterium]|nr:type IV pilus assembly protein PilM [Patescibacteria group bacterium]